MALFQSDLRDAVKRLGSGTVSSPQERDEILAFIAGSAEVKSRDVVWMLFRPDRAMRETSAAVLKRLRDPEAIDAFIVESKSKPEAALRAALPLLIATGIPGLEARLGQFLAKPEKETKDSREMQELARRIVLEAPLTAGTAVLLWQLEGSASVVEDRVAYLTKLASAPPDPKSFSRWQRLASDKNPVIRERGVDVLARHAPAASVDVLVENLPNVSYATQQVVIAALTQAATASGPEFVDRLLPLMASGEPSTRTAVMKILVATAKPRDVVRRYVVFAKTLPGFVRDRTLEALREFGPAVIEPVIELLSDKDEDVRASAVAVASSFDDPRAIPATIGLLRDPDWWIRIAAADSLGRTKDPRAVEALIGALADPDLKWSAVEALGRIGDPRALAALGKMLADPMIDVRIEVMQALRHFDHPQVTQAFAHVAANDPERAVRARAVDLLDEIALSKKETKSQVDSIRDRALAVQSRQGDPQLHALLIATRNKRASDFHLSVGQPPIMRLAADLIRADAPPFTAEQTEAMLKEILTEPQWKTLEKSKQLDFCYFIPQGGRYRGNVFNDHRGYNAVFRVIPEKPPTIVELGLPPQLSEIADYHQGLVIICGPSGSGKSTTLAALVNLFNETRNDHILTMEDPVEFVHPFKHCLVNQREVGKHTESFARALRAALREDPDVIVIGELRDNDSVSLALTAAETGHIVLGTLNATSAPKAIDRIISSFPVDEQPQIRASMSESLKYIVAQKLLPSKVPHKQVAAFEVLKGTSTIANMIRDEKTFQIFSAMQIGRSQGMQTFDEALKDLLKRDQITAETAYMAAQKKEDFEALLSPQFLNSLKA